MNARMFVSLVGVTLALLGASSSAQSRSGQVFARHSKPLKSVSLDLATGTITRGPAVNERGATTTVDFDNNDLGGFVGVDTGGGFCEWFDAGVKGFAGNASDLMNNFVFAYCSSMLAPGSGGPGGSVGLGFYEGYALFGGTPTTAVAVFTLTGLPANSASSSFFNGFDCFFIDVALGPALVAFADGPVGYSWHFLDTGTDGTLAGTWPFLSCVVSCSGAILQVDGQGMTDAIDQYCPPGTLRATFTFGTTSGSFTSMSMDIREATDQAATCVLYNATSTPNPDILWSTTAIVGGTWSGTITRPCECRSTSSAPRACPATMSGTSTHLTHPCAPEMTGAIVNVRSSRIPLPNGVQGPSPLPIGAGGRILTAGVVLNTSGTTAISGRARAFSLAIPNSIGHVGLHFAAQATVFGGGVRLSSAVECTIGRF